MTPSWSISCPQVSGQALSSEKLDSSFVRELDPKIRQSKERLESSRRSPYPEFPFPMPRSVVFSLPRCSVLDTPPSAPQSATTAPFALPRAFCSRFPELVASNGGESPLLRAFSPFSRALWAAYYRANASRKCRRLPSSALVLANSGVSCSD